MLIREYNNNNNNNNNKPQGFNKESKKIRH